VFWVVSLETMVTVAGAAALPNSATPPPSAEPAAPPLAPPVPLVARLPVTGLLTRLKVRPATVTADVEEMPPPRTSPPAPVSSPSPAVTVLEETVVVSRARSKLAAAKPPPCAEPPAPPPKAPLPPVTLLPLNVLAVTVAVPSPEFGATA
jgi:hypothetical protein